MTDQTLTVPEITDLVDRLIDVLYLETDYLSLGRAGDVGALQRDKIRLTAALRQCNDLLQADQVMAETDDVDGELLDLEDALIALQAAGAANERALRAALRTSDRMLKAIVQATSEARGERDTRYNSEGLTGAPLTAAARSIRAIDETL